MKRSAFHVLLKRRLSVPSSSFTFVMQRNSTVVNGLFDCGTSIILELHRGGFLAATIKNNQRLLLVDDVDLNSVEHHQILDMGDEGDRWEGDVLKDKPCGWGILYDKEGRMAYKGFRIGEVNVCWGCKYYADIEKIEYEGEWYSGMRWGLGIQFDRHGAVMYCGRWVNDQPIEERVVITPGNELFHSHVKELIVSDECCNDKKWRVLSMEGFLHLTRLRVGNNCFKNVEVVDLIGLRALKTVAIGGASFTWVRERSDLFFLSRYSNEKDPKGRFRLKKCPKLRELRVGYYSFHFFNKLEIEDVDALEVIEIGDLNEESCNFQGASLELKSIQGREA